MVVQATVEIILHATEDVPKFYTVIETLFGFDEKEISKTLTTGHYGNEITVLHMSAKKHKADKIIHAISKGLLDLGDLASQITERLSDSGLYVRLNKQEFVQGRIALQDGGAVKVRIYTPVYVKKNAESEYISLFQ